MKNKLVKLIDVKTIVTFTLLFSYVGLIYLGKEVPSDLNKLLEYAIIFFFGTQIGKKVSEDK